MDEALGLLDDHIVKSQAMAASPFAKPFIELLQPWERRLSRFQVGQPGRPARRSRAPGRYACLPACLRRIHLPPVSVRSARGAHGCSLGIVAYVRAATSPLAKGV